MSQFTWMKVGMSGRNVGILLSAGNFSADLSGDYVKCNLSFLELWTFTCQVKILNKFEIVSASEWE